MSLDEATLELHVKGEPVVLRQTPMRVLVHLLEHADRVVSKDELAESCWPGRILSDGVLTTTINRLRTAISDHDGSVVRTLHGVGYRLGVPVTVEHANHAGPVHNEPVAEHAGPAITATRSGVPRLVWLAAALAFVVLTLLADRLWLHRDGTRPVAPAPAPPPVALSAAPARSVAVLPFVNLSPDPVNEYFADGLSEELLDQLSRIPGLQVTGHMSSFYFKNKTTTVDAVGRLLHVAHVLEGSVRRDGARLRVTAQLVRADNGYQLWTETYDRAAGDLLDVQLDIARAVAQALKIKLADMAPPAVGVPQDADAYASFLQARFYAARLTRPDLAKAARFIDDTLRREPSFAGAWAERAVIRTWQSDHGFIPATSGYASAREDAEKAIALNDRLSAAHFAMGVIEFVPGWNWAAAKHEFDRALELDPQDADALDWSGDLAATRGRYPEAIGLFERACNRDPLNGAYYNDLALALSYAGRHSEAQAALLRALDLNPALGKVRYLLARELLAQGNAAAALDAAEHEVDPGWRRNGLILAKFALGRRAAAIKLLADAETEVAEFGAFQLAESNAFIGRRERALDWLERAYENRDGGLTLVLGDPLLKGLVDTPRYQRLLAQLQLAD